MNETPQPLDQEDLIGQVIHGRYRIVEPLGEGGMGAIYVAEHLTLHKRVALKVVRAKHAGNEAAAARFAREAMVTATIDHPNVISALDYGQLEDGGAFLAMQLVEGGTLTELLEREGRLHWARAAHLGAQIADAVLAACKHGIIHRDLKPDNLLIQIGPAGDEQVKVLDFGIAKFSRDSLAPPSARGAQPVTQVGIVVGTPGYMAPEQALGEQTDHRADLYALGVILWESVVGDRLWHGEGIRRIIRKQLNELAPPLRKATGDDSIPEALEQLVAMLTLREADQRPGDLQQVRDILRDVAESGRLSELDAPVDRALSERVRALSPFQDTLLGMPADQPLSPDTDAAAAEAIPTPPKPRPRLWASLFAVSLIGGLWLGMGGDDQSSTAGHDDGSESADADAGEQGAPGQRPTQRGTGLPSSLDPQLNTLIQAEGRGERVAAAETLLGHIPVGDVPGYVRLLAHFQLAETCQSKADVVQKIDALGDPRALPALVLASQRAKEGCGRYNRDCLSCMRGELNDTITRLESKQITRR